MNKYMILYIAEVSAEDQMESVGSEERQEIMGLWMAWYGKHGSAILEMGAPLGKGMNLSPTGSVNARSGATGYSIVQAADLDTVHQMVSDHPHLMMPGGSIDVFEMLAM